MWMHTILMLSAVIAAAPGPIPPGEFEATVTTVVSGDAVRVTVSDGDALVGLYGVSCLRQARDSASAARTFVQERTGEEVITVRPIKAVAGMPYVEIILPSGEILNHLLLQQGLADFDLLTAAGDAVYASLAGQEPSSAPEAEADAANPAPSSAPISIEEFRMRRHLRDTAAFEAGLEKWGAMPKEYRDAVRRNHEESLIAADAGGAALLENLRGEVETRNVALESSANAIANRRSAVVEDRERLNNDPELQWNTRRYQNYLADYYADRAAGRHRSARISRQLADRYRVRASFDQARVDAQYETVRSEHESAIRSLTAEQRAQADALRRANVRLRTANIQTSDRIARLLRTIVQLDLYEQAVAQEMHPTLPLRHIAVVEGEGPERSPLFALEAPVGRVDWYANPQRPDAQLSGTIHNASDDRPIAQFRSTTPPHESFLLLDGPGEFYITTNTSGPVSYLVDVFAIEGE